MRKIHHPHQLQDLDPGIRGFNMFIDFDEIEEEQNTQGPTPSNRRQDYEDHSSHQFRARTHRKTYQTNMDGNLCPIKHYNHDNEGLHPQEHMITKG